MYTRKISPTWSHRWHVYTHITAVLDMHQARINWLLRLLLLLSNRKPNHFGNSFSWKNAENVDWSGRIVRTHTWTRSQSLASLNHCRHHHHPKIMLINIYYMRNWAKEKKRRPKECDQPKYDHNSNIIGPNVFTA